MLGSVVTRHGLRMLGEPPSPQHVHEDLNIHLPQPRPPQGRMHACVGQAGASGRTLTRQERRVGVQG